MIKLKNIILQLEEEKYKQLSKTLQENKAEKFNTLLEFYRQNPEDDDFIQKKLDINSSAFYTLKSRLYDKIQDFLVEGLETPKADLLKKVANIPELVFQTHRDTAIAILSKLEKELKEYDMPYELTSVYNALKKLHLHSQKYYEYTQLYNRHVAYTLAIDKAEDLLLNFVKKTGEYYLSRDPVLPEVMKIMKDEMSNLCRLYESHRLMVYRSILDISFYLYIPMPQATKQDQPVEDVLAKCFAIIKEFEKDNTYKYLKVVFDFLAFEYYQKIKELKKANQYFEFVNSNLITFFLYDHTCFVSKFLLSKLEKYSSENLEANLLAENKDLEIKCDVDENDVPNFVLYKIYLAASSYLGKKYNDCIITLNELLNKVSLKSLVHAEIEVKLLLCLAYFQAGKPDLVSSTLRSVSRKIKEANENLEYENANTLAKMFSLAMGSSAEATKTQKLNQLGKMFEMLNSSPNRILGFIKIDENLVRQLARA